MSKSRDNFLNALRRMIIPTHIHECKECGLISVCRGHEAVDEDDEDYDCSQTLEGMCNRCLVQRADKIIDELTPGGYLTPKQSKKFVNYMNEIMILEGCSYFAEYFGLSGQVEYT